MRKRVISGILAGMGILLLIIDSKTALAGAQDAISLCISSVIPSLFPFLLLSRMLTSAINGSSSPVLRPIRRLTGIPSGAEGVLITGILGGYPTGAQAVYHAWNDGQLSRDDANRMLTFCSNAGPAFFFGILGEKFSNHWAPLLLWIIHIISAIIIALLIPKNTAPKCESLPTSPITITQSLKTSVVTMGYVCGWILCMRVVLAFMDRWVLWLLPQAIQVAIYGILELANGCCHADQIPIEGLRFIVCSTMLAFGGICVAMQTAAVTGDLGIKHYLKGKFLQTTISLLLSITVQSLIFPKNEQVVLPSSFVILILLAVLAYSIILRKREKKGSIPFVFGV